MGDWGDWREQDWEDWTRTRLGIKIAKMRSQD